MSINHGITRRSMFGDAFGSLTVWVSIHTLPFLAICICILVSLSSSVSVLMIKSEGNPSKTEFPVVATSRF